MTTIAPVPGHVPVSTGSRGPRGRPARWAVGLSLLSAGTFLTSFAAIAIAYAIGEEAAVEDTLLAIVLLATGLAGVLGSLVALALAVVAKTKREHWPLLWLPLTVFPAIVLFLVLGEAFWWE